MADEKYSKILDESRVSQLWEKIKSKFVAKESGKGLSTNDFTNEYKTKVDSALQSYTETDPIFAASPAASITSANISNWNNADENVQSDWNATSGDAYIKNKPTIPTDNNQLSNGAGYQTSSQVQALINNSIKDLTGIDFQVVGALPTIGNTGTIYLIAIGGEEEQNIYEEYIWIENGSTGSYELLGTTKADISDCVKYTDISIMTEAELDAICV